MPDALRSTLKQHKAELVQYLQDLEALKCQGTEPLPEILARPAHSPLELSFAQNRLWFIEQLGTDSRHYNISLAYQLEGTLRPEAVKQALLGLLERHQVLRTTYQMNEGTPQLQLMENFVALFEASFLVQDLRNLAPSSQKHEIQSRVSDAAEQPFDISRDLMLRSQLLTLSAQSHVLLLSTHHIASDGWSMGILMREFCQLYSSHVHPSSRPLEPLALQYSDYAHWQKEWMQGATLEQQLDYWKTQLKGVPAVHHLPLDRPRPSNPDFKGATLHQTLNGPLVEKIQAMAQGEQVTLFMWLQSAFSVLLSRMSNETDIVMGSPIAGRSHQALEPLVGCFVNTLVLRTDLSGSPSFRSVLQQTKQMVLGAFSHEHVPFEMIVEALQPERNNQHSPIFQVTFSLQSASSASEESTEFSGLQVSALERDRASAHFDLTVVAEEQAEGVVLHWNHATQIFDSSTIERMMGHFEQLLEGMVATPDVPVLQLPLLNEKERHQALDDWNQTHQDFPQELCLHEWIEKQCQQTPDATALVFYRYMDESLELQKESMSYQDLNEKANRLARLLVKEGVQADTLVGISLERSPDLLVGILAILKAGGAYVPLDPDYPAHRLSHMLEDSAVSLVLSHQHLKEQLPFSTQKILCLDDPDFQQSWLAEAARNLSKDERGVSSSNLAYVIYTSGSTGLPKGVMVEHLGLCNLALAQEKNLDLGPQATMLQYYTQSFDAGAEDWSLAWTSGARLIMPEKSILLDLSTLSQIIQEEQITHVHIPPSILALLDAKQLSSIRYCEVGGEKYSMDLVKTWGPGRSFFNEYGPTEATISSSMQACTPADRNMCIGLPLANVQYYVLNAEQQLCPIGVLGELHIGGIGIARGYLNQAELTHQKFVSNPFAQDPSSRLYKTGDWVRRFPDGNLEYMGRLDHQIKIRGFRVELNEIETQLAQHPHVQGAVVLARKDQKEEHYLVAYVVYEGSIPLSERPMISMLKTHLAERVPVHMIPSAFVVLEEWPLTSSEKIDRDALPLPSEKDEVRQEYIAPISPLEQQLCEIWQGLLPVEKVGMADNFFELGGHSLLAVKTISKINRALKVQLKVADLFDHNTLSEMVALIDSQQVDEGPSLEKIVPAPEGSRGLSFQQQRLWWMEQLDSESSQFHIAGQLQMEGKLNQEALHHALNQIVQRHEILRTTYTEKENVCQTRVLPISEIPLSWVDLSGIPEAEQKQGIEILAKQEAQRPFDLSTDLMLRASLIRQNSARHTLLITMHHIASDGWSMGLLIQDFCQSYRAFVLGNSEPLPALPLQYADYAHWQSQRLQGEVLQHHLDYWTHQLEGLPAVHRLPLDRSRPALQSFEGSSFAQMLPYALSQNLNQMAQEQGVSLFMLLHAAFATLLARFSGESDIVVGIPVANREQVELSDLVGFFVNTLVIRVNLADNSHFLDLLQQSKSRLLEAYEHQGLPFEKLVDELNPERNLSHSPLFQIMLSFDNNEAEVLDLPGLQLTPQAQSTKTAKYDLSLGIVESSKGLELNWEYASSLFEETTIESMAQCMAELLGQIVQAPETAIDALPFHRPENHASLVLLPELEKNAVHDEDDSKIQGLHQLVERHAISRPKATAMVFPDAEGGWKSWSYQGLNRRANRLAHWLQNQNWPEQAVVAIDLPRSENQVVALLAVLKSGHAFFPLDPAAPHGRLCQLVEQVGVTAILSESSRMEGWESSDLNILCLDDASTRLEVAQQSLDNPSSSASLALSEQLAYLIQTSGSSGTPKAVAVQHGAIVQHVEGIQTILEWTQEDHCLHFASLHFDAALEQLFGPLSVGASVYWASHEDLSSQKFVEVLDQQKITVADLPPSFLIQLLEDVPEMVAALPLKTLIVGGEALPPALANRCLKWKISQNLFNAYGPTETVVSSTIYKIKESIDQARTPIGFPVPGRVAMVVDSKHQPLPNGVPGELWIGGPCLAQGYWMDAPQTDAQFINHKFSGCEPTRWYRTGDRVRRVIPVPGKPAVLEFLGRADQQVKIRGFRVELGEIEAALADHPKVQQAVVLLQNEEDLCQLLAFGVVRENLQETEVQHWLKARLPRHMVPSRFVALDELPLTSTGKVDRHGLLSHPLLHQGPSNETAEAIKEPQSPTEEKLVLLWQKLLNREQVSTSANFFDLGGHSLLATRLMADVREIWQVDLPMRVLFEAQSIEELAPLIEQGQKTKIPSIGMAPEDQNTTLSFAQQRLWLLDQIEGQSAQYNMPSALELQGRLNVAVLFDALYLLVERHAVLRTVFFQEKGEVQAKVLEDFSVNVTFEDMNELSYSKQIKALQELQREEANKPFDLSNDLMVRGTLVQLNAESHVLLLTLHHIATDGWSMGILTREFSALYDALLQGQPNPLPALAVQYADYAHWQQQWMQGEVLDTHMDYWLNTLADLPPVHQLPLDHVRPRVLSSQGASYGQQLSHRLSLDLSELAQQQGATLFMVVQAAFAALLHRYSGESDIVMGTPVANRDQSEVAPLVGFFVNTLVLRSDLSDDQSFLQLLEQSKNHLLAAYDHQQLPFEKLVDELQPERSLDHSPLFQVMLAFQNNEKEDIQLSDLTIKPLENEMVSAKFDLLLNVEEHDQGLRLSWNYSTDLWQASTVQRMAQHFENLLKSIVETPQNSVSRLPWLSEAERLVLLEGKSGKKSGQTPAEWNSQPLVHHWFEEQAQKQPQATALIFGNQTRSYQAINQEANRIAHYLQAHGVKPNTVVAFLLERSFEMVTALLGILKAGGAYLPLDPKHPQQRLQEIVEDAGAHGLISSSDLAQALLPKQENVLLLDDPEHQMQLAEYSAENPQISELGLDDLAYVLYTSGTTGKPKGVLQVHRTLSHLVTGQEHDDALKASQTSMQFAAIVFDVSIQEIATAWKTGSPLVLLSSEERMDPHCLLQKIEEQQIERVFLPPAMFATVCDAWQPEKHEVGCLKEIIVAGEALVLSEAMLSMLQTIQPILLNHYGPTETHVCTHFRVPFTQVGDRPAIGIALGHSSVFVLDVHGQPQPLGVPGELHVGGPCLARGYQNDEELTEERFVPNPFSDQQTARLYKTGDRVRWTEDGVLQFLGRSDDQIKLRGFRIELGEIEAALCQHDSIQEAVVRVLPSPNQGPQLVAYVTCIPDISEPAEWRNFLQQTLPDYMTPAALVVLDVLPLTANGKVNAKALPMPDFALLLEGHYVAPDSEIEFQLVQLWESVLGSNRIGVQDNFFHLGGHSLLAVKLASAIQSHSGKACSIRTIMECPTIAELAIHLAQQTTSELPWPTLQSDPTQRDEPFPLTLVQQAYWLGRRDDFVLGNVGTHGYSENPVRHFDLLQFETVVNRMIARHDMLRMVVTADGHQKILPEVHPYTILCQDLRHCSPDEQAEALQETRGELSHQVFTGEQWPLFDLRVSLLKGTQALIHFSMDALVLDASSATILAQEIVSLAQDPEQVLPPLSISFRDYVMAEQALQQTEWYAQSEQYWKQRLALFPGGPDLPLAVDPSQIEKPTFERRSSQMDAEAWTALKTKAGQFQVTPTVLILHCFGVVLKNWCSSHHFALNLTLFNRLPFHEEVDRLLGDFTSLTLLELDFRDAAMSLEKGMQTLQKQLWSDMENRYFGGIEMQRELARTLGQSVNFPVVVTSTLALDEQEVDALDFTGFSSTQSSDQKSANEGELPESYAITQTPQVWLDFQVSESEGALQFNWDSVEGLFPPGMVESMFGGFENLLQALADDDCDWRQFQAHSIVPEQQAQIDDSNATEKVFPPGLLHDPLLRQIERQGVKIAISSNAKKLSYDELGQRSLQLAATLHDRGAKPNTLVAVVMEKGWQQVVAVLGILQAGAAYLPVDANFPEDRIALLLEAGEIEQVVTTPQVQNRLDVLKNYQVALVEELHGIPSDFQELALPAPPQETDLAYVIFTSGSTGMPKGVMIDHRGASNTVQDITERFEVQESDKVLGLSSLSFDLSVYDVFGVLGAGGTLVLPQPDENRDNQAWLHYLRDEKITLWNTVPALMQMLVEAAEQEQRPLDLRVVWMSGDWIATDLPQRIHTLLPQCEVISMGGATEASIWSIYYPVEQTRPEWSSIPYGRALANQSFHVLQADLEPAPYWVPGDLYIGGIGLAQGYWKDKKKTQSHFVVHPKTGERLYRTGDRGRWLPDVPWTDQTEGLCAIEFLGRTDFQVKVQGYRIELGEIEATIESHPWVQQAIVGTYDQGQTKHLVAHVQPDVDVLNAASTEASKDTLEVDGSRTEEGVITNKMERKLFVLEQKAIRQDLVQTVEISLLKPERKHRLNFGQEPETAAEQLAQFFYGLRQHTFPEWPLPKYFYPSAGGLYPVQTYCSIAPGAIEGVEAGCYYFNPVSHCLVRTAPNSLEIPQTRSGLHFFLVADLAAIAPLYGRHSEAFCHMEAGYMGQLLQSNEPAGLNLETFDFSFDLQESFQLGSEHRVLKQFAAISGKPQNPPHFIPQPMGLVERKSYRQFNESPVAAVDLLSNLAPLTEDNGFDSALQILLVVKPGRVEGLEGGVYRLDSHLVEPLADFCSLEALYRLSAEIEESAAFAVCLVAPSQSGPLPHSSGALYDAGYLGQTLMNHSTERQIGWCAIGIVEESEAFATLSLPSGHSVVHSFLGGGITPEQIQTLKFEKAAPQDLTVLLREHLQGSLPAYMIPNRVLLQEHFPLTANGKVDRNALHQQACAGLTDDEMDGGERQEFQAPEGPIEMQLCEIWQDLLQLDAISVTANFFQLGGDSLLAARMVSILRKNWHVEIPIKAVFELQTVRELSTLIDQASSNQVPAIGKAPSQQNLVLSFAQERLWVMDQFEENDFSAYNEPTAFVLHGKLNVEALHRAMQTIVERHEVLRTTYIEGVGEVFQQVNTLDNFALPVQDLSHLEGDALDAEVRQLTQIEAQKAFDLSCDLMLRASLLKLDELRHVLLVTFHHIAADGWSMGVLTHELSALYPAFVQGAEHSLPELTTQYADYAHWQRQWLQGPVLQKQMDFWLRQLQNLPDCHRLPTDFPRPAQQSYRGAEHHQKLSSKIQFGLNAMAYEHDATLFMVLHSAFSQLLSTWSGEKDIVIGTPVANRDQAEIAALVGFFVNTLVLRLDLSQDPNFVALLDQSKQILMDAYDHQQVPFDKLVLDLMPERSLSHHPLFQVMLVLQNNQIGQLKLPGLTLSPVGEENHMSKFDLSLRVMEEDGLSLVWEYATDLFEPQTIADLATHFESLLETIIAGDS